MKILKTILCVACFAVLLPTTMQAQEAESDIMELTEYTIKFGENSKFTEGVKKWKKCYKDNNGTGTWNTWHRLQGKGNVYVVSNRFENWAEMDESDAAGKACGAVALEFILPHIESTEVNMTRSIPEFSRKEGLGDNTVVWVTSFKVNDDKAFNEAVDEMSSAISKKEGDKRGYWYRYMGGEAGDYFVSTPFKDFADLDTDRESIWKLYEGANGKTKTEALRQKFKDVIDEQWSYTYTLESELSMN
ncbi:hypothetical protein [uncultured Winogradskyella sp.]|uniref:hypothetical protein n=1 Tax=uncultured Winogradskyella sp. TaxID=395353 RepID=UPI0026307E34|nr:hypothetical protein [uncultured Winogradskyella sp.]